MRKAETVPFETLVDSVRADPEAERAYLTRRTILQTARYVQSLRQHAGFSQTELARRSGLSQAQISHIENGHGRHGPSIDVLARIAAACGRELTFSA